MESQGQGTLMAFAVAPLIKPLHAWGWVSEGQKERQGRSAQTVDRNGMGASEVRIVGCAVFSLLFDRTTLFFASQRECNE